MTTAPATPSPTRRFIRSSLPSALAGALMLAVAAAGGSVPAYGESRSAAASALGWTLRADDTRIDFELIGIVDAARRAELRRWLDEAALATRLPSGRFPLMQARVVVREIDSRSASPVPWGQTRRGEDVAVLLFVRRGAGPEALRADWTAVHEFAHLAHPYLGDDGRWLAEGLASYQQNVLRARAGLLTPEDAWRRLDAGFRRGEAVGEGPTIEALGRAGTMRTYWAGALYWLEADLALRRRHGLSLQQALDRHAQCCLDGTDWLSPAEYVRALDRAAGVAVFEALYRRHRGMRAMPASDSAYAALGIVREGERLRFAGDARARALRAAVMAAD